MDIKYNVLNLTQLVFEVTDACNLKCKYCGYGEMYEGHDKREDKNLPFKKAKLLIDYLFDLWKKERYKSNNVAVTISFYGGEPLVNIILIKEIVNYIEQKPFVGKKFFYNMTTNGVLLDRHLDYLMKKEFRLLVSLDGNKDGNGYRVDHNGKNSFDKIVSNIKILRDKSPEYFDRYVQFNAVLHSKNSVESIHRYIYDNFGKKPRISSLNNSGIRKDKVEEFYKTYQNFAESLKQATNCKDLEIELATNNPKTSFLTSYLYSNSGNIFNTYNNLFFDKADIPSIHMTGTCFPFAKKMFVTVNGRILQCEKIDHEYSMGYISDKEVVLDFDLIAKKQNQLLDKVRSQCQPCGMLGNCSQCIYFIDKLSSEDLPKCNSLCTIQDYRRRTSELIDYLSENPRLYNDILHHIALR